MMNKTTLLTIALLCCVFSFAQNIDTTKYQKVTPNDTIKNYYNQNNNGNTSPNDSIKNFYPNDNQQDQTYPGERIDNSTQNQPKRDAVRKPIPQQSPLMQKLYFGKLSITMVIMRVRIVTPKVCCLF